MSRDHDKRKKRQRAKKRLIHSNLVRWVSKALRTRHFAGYLAK